MPDADGGRRHETTCRGSSPPDSHSLREEGGNLSAAKWWVCRDLQLHSWSDAEQIPSSRRAVLPQVCLGCRLGPVSGRQALAGKVCLDFEVLLDTRRQAWHTPPPSPPRGGRARCAACSSGADTHVDDLHP